VVNAWLEQSNVSCTTRASCGVVRKNPLKPRWVSDGDEDSGFTKGMQLRSALRLAASDPGNG
jgi:hypothetical protein